MASRKGEQFSPESDESVDVLNIVSSTESPAETGKNLGDTKIFKESQPEISKVTKKIAEEARQYFETKRKSKKNPQKFSEAPKSEKKESENQPEYPNTIAYFKYLLGDPTKNIKAGDARLESLRAEKQKELDRGEQKDKEKIDVIDSKIHPIKQTYLKIINGLDRGNSVGAERAINSQLKKIELETNNKSDLKNNNEYQKLLVLLSEIAGPKLESKQKKIIERAQPKIETESEKLDNKPITITETTGNNRSTHLESEQIIVGIENQNIESAGELSFSNPKIEIQTNTIDVKKDLAKQLGELAENEFQKSVKNKEKDSKDSFIEKQEKNLSEKLFQESFDGLYAELSKSEKDELNSLIINGSKVLDGKDVKELFTSGVSLADIKGVKYNHWWSRKIKSKLSGEPVDDEKFDKLVKEKVEAGKEKALLRAKKILGGVWEKSKQVFVDQVIANELSKLESPSQTEKNPSPSFTLEEKQELKKEIKSLWSKAEKIDKALKTGRKLKIESGEVLDSKTQKNELEDMRGFLSDEIIKNAEKLTGRKLKKEAIEKTGYKLDKNPEKQKEYQKWLTDEIKKIYYQEISTEEWLQKNLPNKSKTEKIKKSKISEVKETPRINTGAKLKPIKRLVDKIAEDNE